MALTAYVVAINTDEKEKAKEFLAQAEESLDEATRLEHEANDMLEILPMERVYPELSYRLEPSARSDEVITGRVSQEMEQYVSLLNKENKRLTQLTSHLGRPFSSRQDMKKRHARDMQTYQEYIRALYDMCPPDELRDYHHGHIMVAMLIIRGYHSISEVAESIAERPPMEVEGLLDEGETFHSGAIRMMQELDSMLVIHDDKGNRYYRNTHRL